MKSKELLDELKKAGWTVKRIRGSHYHLQHEDYNHVVTVPHPKKSLPKGLVKAIKKQAHIVEAAK